MKNREQYWTGWELRRTRFEKAWKPRIIAALNNQVRSFVQVIKWQGTEQARSNINQIVKFEQLGTIIKALYIRAGLLQANTVYSLVKDVKYRGFGFNQEWTSAIEAYFRMHLLNKAVLPITDTTKEIILKALEEGLNEGLGVDDIVKLILTKTKEINRKRANVIVRTESVRAMNVGSLIGANQSNILLDKVWITAKDERVRSSHRRLNDVKLEMEDVFSNGCAFPGDPNAAAKEVINCRCTLGFVPRRVNGRVVRKPAVSPFVQRSTGREIAQEIIDEIIENVVEDAVSNLLS